MHEVFVSSSVVMQPSGLANSGMSIALINAAERRTLASRIAAEPKRDVRLADTCNNRSEMPALLHKLNYTYAEYLGFEASSNVKHEFLGGQIYAMAGGTPEHAALAAAAITLLGPQLRGGQCRPYNSDLRVRTPTGLTTYPDVTIVRGPREIDGVDPLAVTNPRLIVEVLSRSTEEYDSGDKFAHYKAFPSL